MTPSETAMAAMELIPLAHKDEVGQGVFRNAVHDLLAGGACVGDAYSQALAMAVDLVPDFEPRCDRSGLLALDRLDGSRPG